MIRLLLLSKDDADGAVYVVIFEVVCVISVVNTTSLDIVFFVIDLLNMLWFQILIINKVKCFLVFLRLGGVIPPKAFCKRSDHNLPALFC